MTGGGSVTFRVHPKDRDNVEKDLKRRGYCFTIDPVGFNQEMLNFRVFIRVSVPVGTSDDSIVFPA